MMKQSPSRLILLSLILAAGTLWVERVFFFKQGVLESAASYLLRPFLEIAHTITSYMHNRTQQITEQRTLKACLAHLEAENEELKAKMIELSGLLGHAQRTDELERFSKRYSITNGVIARILVKHIGGSHQYYIINRGTRDGIKLNMVALYKFQLVGRVVECFPCHSKVLLITDERCKVSAYTNTTHAKGIAHGLGEPATCELTYVNHLSQISKGDLVLSSGEGMIFPEGFCLGKIASYTTQHFYHTVSVQPLADFTTIDYCMIVGRDTVASF